MSALDAAHLDSSIATTSLDNPDDGLASSTTSDTLISGRAEHLLDGVEVAVQEVYRFAHAKAQHLANTVGRDPDYYMRMMFRRYALLHPMPKRTSHYLASSMKRCGESLAFSRAGCSLTRA